LINIENASFIYPDGHQAISNLNLSIKDNESIGIVGANGAGKSTLLTLLTGINFANEGSLTVNNIKVSQQTLYEVRRRVGIVFQNPDEQLFMAKVYDDLAFGPRNYGLAEEEVAQRVASVLKKLEIEHLADRVPHKLSGGEKRSAAIASVLTMEPVILLLDEPSSFLDPKCRRNLIQILKSLKLTKIIATHDLDLVLDVCDRVIVLKSGTLFADGDPYAILTQEKLMEDCGLEIPLSLRSCPAFADGRCIHGR
jgi:cobalt/nickel transport system ATP-binding protein